VGKHSQLQSWSFQYRLAMAHRAYLITVLGKMEPKAASLDQKNT